MSMLCITYLKCFNEQRLLLKINIMTVAISFLLAVLSSVVFHNLTMAIYSMIIAVAFRCVISILFLQKRMGMGHGYTVVIQDLAMIFVFLVFQSLLPEWLSLVSITLLLSVLYIYRRKDIISYIKIFKR